MWRAVSKRKSREIDASDASLQDGPFVCINPSCRRPVTLHRTRPNPHFQHSRGKANPACEHYGSRTSHLSSFRLSPRSPSRGLGEQAPVLTFSGDPPAHFSLSLRLPLPQPEEAWGGCVVVHEHGERIVLCDQLKRPIPDLRPKSDYPVSFRGEVPEGYRRLLHGDLPGLRQHFNLFPYGIGATRLIEPDEAIQADKDYWVLSKESLPGIGEPSWIRHSSAWHGWHVTLISLPSLRSMSHGERALVERIFQRSLLAARFSAVIVSPLPHHFSDGGIAVYPNDVDELQIALSEPSEVQLSCDGQPRGAIRYDAEGICTAECGPCGRWTLSLNGQRLLEWMKSEVDFFEPAGISLCAGGEELPLLSQEAQSWLEAQPAGETVFIRSPNAEIAECLSINSTSVAPTSLEIELPAMADRVHWIDAGNFGRMTYGRTTPAGEERCDLADVRAQVTWLKSMALHGRFSGPHHLHGSPKPWAPRWIAELTRVGWASSLIAQVRDIQNQLIRAGVWRV